MASRSNSGFLQPLQPIESSASSPVRGVTRSQPWRLRKHAHYQQAYKLSRKQQSSSMAYFVAVRPAAVQWPVARVGLTAGRVLGNAVERNRIKRRMREVVRANLRLLPAHVDVILHPRRSVLTLEYAALLLEVERIFSGIATKAASGSGTATNVASGSGIATKVASGNAMSGMATKGVART